MKNTSRGTQLALATAFATFSAMTVQSVYAGTFDGLSSADQKKLMNSKTVVKTEDVSGSAWPRITVYRIIKATPEECAALLHDYNFQSQYIGGGKMTISHIEGYNEGDSDEVKLAKLTANPVNVEYQVKDSIPYIPIPPIIENYTVTDTLTEDHDQGSYKITWTQYKADTNVSTDGFAQFEPVKAGSADTLVVYQNLTVPKDRLGVGWAPVKSRVVSSIQSAVEQIDSQVTLERNSNQTLLNQQIGYLRLALKK